MTKEQAQQIQNNELQRKVASLQTAQRCSLPETQSAPPPVPRDPKRVRAGELPEWSYDGGKLSRFGSFFAIVLRTDEKPLSPEDRAILLAALNR